MADKKISQLLDGGLIQNTDSFEIARVGGFSKKITADKIKEYCYNSLIKTSSYLITSVDRVITFKTLMAGTIATLPTSLPSGCSFIIKNSVLSTDEINIVCQGATTFLHSGSNMLNLLAGQVVLLDYDTSLDVFILNVF